MNNGTICLQQGITFPHIPKLSNCEVEDGIAQWGKGEIPLQAPKLPSLCHHSTQKDGHRRHKVG